MKKVIYILALASAMMIKVQVGVAAEGRDGVNFICPDIKALAKAIKSLSPTDISTAPFGGTKEDLQGVKYYFCNGTKDHPSSKNGVSSASCNRKDGDHIMSGEDVYDSICKPDSPDSPDPCSKSDFKFFAAIAGTQENREYNEHNGCVYEKITNGKDLKTRHYYTFLFDPSSFGPTVIQPHAPYSNFNRWINGYCPVGFVASDAEDCRMTKKQATSSNLE